MKIGYISTFPPSKCGIAEYSYDLISSIKKISKNIDIDVFADEESLERYDYELNIFVTRCFMKGIDNYSWLFEKIREHSPFDIIHIQHEYSLYPPVSKNFIEFLRKIKERGFCDRILITMHNVYHLCKGRSFIEYQKELCKSVDMIIVHSILQQYELWSQGVDMEKIHLIKHGTPLNPYIKYDTNSLAEILGMKDLIDKFKILIPGFIRWDKGFDFVTKISKELYNINRNLVIIISGIPQGIDGIKIYDSIKDYKLENVVTIFKYLSKEELLALIAFSDLILLPYREHPGHLGISGMFHTAVSGLKPIIATKVPRLIEYQELVPELVLNGLNLKEIVDRIIYVYENYSYVLSKVKNKLRKFIFETNWFITGMRHLELYLKRKRISRRMFKVSY